MVKDKKKQKKKKDFAWNMILKNNNDAIRRSEKLIKEIEKDNEKTNLEAGINMYKLEETLGRWHDAEDEKAQRRRLWELSVIEHQEDDEFLKSLGLVHISNLSKKEQDRLKT